MNADDTSPSFLPTVQVVQLRFEQQSEALGIGVARPRLSWIIKTAADNWRQAACEIEATFAETTTNATTLVTGRVASDESVLVDWPFAPLTARARVRVRVRVWGEDGSQSSWSEPAWVEAGLFDGADWQARLITPDWDEDLASPQPAPLLRSEFVLTGEIKQARLYVTALGLYQIEINGAVAGDHLMAPGWTSYHHRLCYQTLDVTELVRSGANAIGATLGDGWYRGRLGYHGGQRNLYGDRLALLAQLEVEFTDGARAVIVSNDTWRAAVGPILASDIYDGECYDARRARDGWSLPGFDDRDWTGVRLLARDLSTLVAPTAPPVRHTETLAPVAILTSPSGRTILDFGQNLVGRLRITVEGERGQTITLRHAEVLEEGELCTRPLRFAAATDTYILRGQDKESWEPLFTFHGFRYAEVEGWPGELDATAIVAVVCHSDLERRGWFACSEPLVNQLHQNVIWSMRGNFLSVPTDCPQRDERLGWTGDIQVFAPTAAFLYDVAGFLGSWLADLAAEQRAAQGVVPFFVPDIMGSALAPAAAWGDAATIVPWVLYQRYGDPGILRQQYASMRSWVDAVAAVAGDRYLWDQGVQFGDWLDPKAPPENPGAARTAPYIVATAYFARSADLLARSAEILGEVDDAAHYAEMAAKVRAAFSHEFVTPGGRVVSDATTAYALALDFALLPDAQQRAAAGKRLAELVRGSGYRISTGFVGTPLLCDALCSVGEVAVAYRLLLQQALPSWLYPVTMGATTIWERWDSMLPDGSINPGEMTSFNHYALGAVADWLHRTVAGLAPASPGYRELLIRPQPGSGITWAQAQHLTPYGMATCRWEIEGVRLTLEIEVPANTSASVYLPGSDGPPLRVGSGKHGWTTDWATPTVLLPRLTLDSPLGDLLEHPLHGRVMEAIAQHNYEFAQRMEGQLTTPLRIAILQNPRADELIARVQSILEEQASPV